MLKSVLLSELLGPLQARLHGADVAFSSVSTDSRRIAAGQLFVALSGPNFDGHQYLSEVASKGAVAALVSRIDPSVELPQLQVSDTRIGLGLLGAYNRQLYQGPLAAVTGSSGKTTVKEMLASVLASLGPVLATRGNLNNDLGAPLTLLELSPEHRAGVIELGASAVGEIAYTVALTQPQVAIITNAGNAHLGVFGGPEKIIEAKGEILEGLPTDGCAVLNLDDRAYPIWRTRAAGRKVLSFARNDVRADFHASDVQCDARGCALFQLHSPLGSAHVKLNLLGLHNVSNALAAAAAAYALGVGLAAIVDGLQALQPIKGRSVIKQGRHGEHVVDDSYNANPQSIKAAIDTLSHFAGRRVLVLGDIGELGQWAETGHREVGSYALGKVDAFYAVGPLMAHAAQAYGASARHFTEQAALIQALAAEQHPETTILIKGSRSAAMDKVVDALCAVNGETH